jgi:diaminopimelate decarboxylase
MLTSLLSPVEFPTNLPKSKADTPVQLVVPQAVVSKFEVQPTTCPIEEYITRTLVDPAFEEEAAYFVDLGAVLRKYKEWVTHLPRVKPFYAVKCNPNAAILHTLASLGVNFDCASKNEIQRILGLGVLAKRIIYANPTKMKSHIRFAAGAGVEMMTFDNADELRKIHETYPNSKIVLRIITDDSHSICKFSTKFGAPLSTCRDLIGLAKELELDLVGVSFHVGSGCMSVQSFVDAITSAHRVFQVAEEFGYKMTVLDLGGGWPGHDNGQITFPEIASAIAPVLDQYFPDTDLIAEPGRYFVSESHTLAVNVFAKRVMEDPSTGNKKFLYYVNDGVYQSFNCIMFDHYEPKPLVLDNKDRTELHKCTIFGPTCDSMDCIAKDIQLPELQVGEWLFFKNMGAYTTAASSPFNGFKASPTTLYITSPVD